jgi:hypothetical protein
MERKCSAYTALEGVATEVVPEKSLPTRHTGFSQEYLPETASSGQAAYHSIVQPYICRDTRVPRSHLGAVSLLVSAPCVTSDNPCYGAHGLALLQERCGRRQF